MKPFLDSLHHLRTVCRQFYHEDEEVVVQNLLSHFKPDPDLNSRIQRSATDFIQQAREALKDASLTDSLLYKYKLSSKEGVALMCLSEALLRIPDNQTASELIEDRVLALDWKEDLSSEDSFLIDFVDYALKLTGKLLEDEPPTSTLKKTLKSLLKKTSKPVILQAVKQAMGLLGKKFVMGETLSQALKAASKDEEKGYIHSYDMLGEAALTAVDAAAYFESYRAAIDAIGKPSQGRGVLHGPGLSVKLSALHPRYEPSQKERVVKDLTEKLEELACLAKSYNIGLTIDAEESYRLDLSMDIFEHLMAQDSIAHWGGLGFVVQAYQKRAIPLLDWLQKLGEVYKTQIPVRLVKGAYWDSEIKLAQEQGVADYPVFTQKSSTDLSYLVCAEKLLESPVFYPQFATHNAHTIATLMHRSEKIRCQKSRQEEAPEFEFQKLYGMGNEVYNLVAGSSLGDFPCRIYAPVGNHKDLLPYLVRRLLENGANSSFINHMADTSIPIESLTVHPYEKATLRESFRHPQIPLPKDLYGEKRLNSKGINLNDPLQLADFQEKLSQKKNEISFMRLSSKGKKASSYNPYTGEPLADYETVPEDHVEEAYKTTEKAALDWERLPILERCHILDKVADAVEEDSPQLVSLCALEAGKTLVDGIAEVREAVDFCRYYAQEAREKLAPSQILPGPSGEENTLRFHGRGTFVCISPWNFPLALFLGQVSAALVSGNAVMAKPAGQTPLIASHAVTLLHKAGVPQEVLHLMTGEGSTVGQTLINHPQCAGVALTGSLETAWQINKTLAHKRSSIVPFIAETGGQNAMIVDSSALPEQVAVDVITSAFRSAGQRCSALRVLFVQEEIAPRLLTLLAGAMEELVLGDPQKFSTDIGPVISPQAQKDLNCHKESMIKQGRLIYECLLPQDCRSGSFVPPAAFEIETMESLTRENFGPLLHIIRYQKNHLDKVIEAINASGFGLTQGIHTRIQSKALKMTKDLRVGNIYVNRNMIGAIVGSQPFGGEGLSGTGPKAGGSQYLYRFTTERTVSINTTAQGGNAHLLTLQEF